MSMNWLRGLRGEQAGSVADPAAVPAELEPERLVPGPEDPPEAWMEAVCHATDKVLAGEWLARVEGEALLAEVAARCRFAEIRLAAVRRIVDPAVLKRVAEASREKDKHVYRYCSERLKAHRQESERARRALDFEMALHALLEATPVSISHLLQIEKELASLGPGGEETAECESLLEQARARVLLETQAQIDLRSRLTEAEALRAAIVAAEAPDGSNMDAWRAQSEEIARIATTGPAWLATLPAARALAAALEEIDAALTEGSAAIARAAEEAAQRELQVARETEEAEKSALAAQQAASADEGKARVQPKGKPLDKEAVLRLLEELEKDLEEGRSAEAEAVLKRVESMLGGNAASGQVARRLQRARAQLARLAGWARWGTDRAREELIGVAEALLRGEPDIDERARAVPLLRREWKNLDAHGPVSQSAWKRFDRALEKAYKPVAELRAAEAAVHAAARVAREGLCDAWESWLAGQDAQAPDFKALEAKREEMILAWRSAPKAGYRDERKLRKRFDALIAGIDTPLEAARAEELARREALVTAAQALAEETDLGRALSAAKSLQRRWKEEARPVQLKHGADQKLWQKFRKACDAAFARRDLEQAAEAELRAEREQARQAEVQAAQAIEAQKKEKHAARFARMAESAGNTDAPADVLERGHAERDALLLDLEIALELQTPESHAAQRRVRMLARLQDRFRSGAPAQADPEALVRQWYAIVAKSDETQTARIDAVVQKLLEPPVPAARPQGAPARNESRRPQGRRDSRP